MNRHLAHLRACFVALAVASAPACAKKAAKPEPATAIATSPSFQPGVRYTYALELTTQTRMGQGTLDLTLQGELELVAESATRVRARMLGVNVLAAAEAQKQRLGRIGEELAEPFLLTFEAGRLTELQVPRRSEALVTGVRRTVAAALQFGRGSGARWTSTEYDATGQYVAEYSAGSDGRYQKRKLRYDKLTASQGATTLKLDLTLVPEIVASEGELRVRGGVLEAVKQKDELRTPLKGATALLSTTVVELTLRSRGAAAPGSAPSAELIRIAAGQASPEPAGLDRALETARIAGMTVEKAVAGIEALEAEKAAAPPTAPALADDAQSEAALELKQKSSLFIALSALLRTEPDAVAKVVSKIRSGSVARASLLDVLSAAGTEAAQVALAALARDGKLPNDTRVLASRSLIRTQHATAATVDALIDFADDPVLATHGIYGLGTAARRLRELGEEETSLRASQFLVARLKAATKDADKIHALRGIANSGFPGALEAVRPLLRSPSATLRGAAVEALRLMPGAEVDGLIVKELATARDANVSSAALNSMKVREPSQVLADGLTQFARTTDDPYARLKAVELLGRWLPKRSELRPVIQELAENDARPKIREAARAALGS